MARVSNPLIGRSKNKIGDVVFSTWKGINVLKSKPASVANPRTDGQVSQRSAFSMIVALARTMLAVLQVTFRQAAVKMSAYNAFVKHNLTEAFTMSGPDAVFDASKLVISKGTLPPVEGLAIDDLTGRSVELSYDDNTGVFGASASDTVTIAVISANGEHAYAYSSGNDRTAGSLSFVIPGSWSLVNARLCVCFVNAAGSKSSDTVNIPLA